MTNINPYKQMVAKAYEGFRITTEPFETESDHPSGKLTWHKDWWGLTANLLDQHLEPQERVFFHPKRKQLTNGTDMEAFRAQDAPWGGQIPKVYTGYKYDRTDKDNQTSIEEGQLIWDNEGFSAIAWITNSQGEVERYRFYHPDYDQLMQERDLFAKIGEQRMVLDFNYRDDPELRNVLIKRGLLPERSKQTKDAWEVVEE